MLTQFVVALLVAIGLVFLILVATFRSLTGRTHLLWRATDRHSDAELKAGFVAAVGWDPSDEGTDWRFFRLMPVRFRATGGTESWMAARSCAILDG